VIEWARVLKLREPFLNKQSKIIGRARSRGSIDSDLFAAVSLKDRKETIAVSMTTSSIVTNTNLLFRI